MQTTDFKDVIFGLFAVSAFIGVMLLAFIDTKSRPVFYDVCKMVISAFLGYMIRVNQ